jgi:hypothetical protein
MNLYYRKQTLAMVTLSLATNSVNIKISTLGLVMAIACFSAGWQMII